MLLTNYKKAAYAAVAVETVEEQRLLQTVEAELQALGKMLLLTIDASQTLRDEAGKTIKAPCNFQEAFAQASQRRNTVLVAFDAQHVLVNAGIYRALKNVMPALRSNASMIMLVAPFWQLPAELQYDVPVLQFPFPDREAVKAVIETTAQCGGIKLSASAAHLDAAAGLTSQQVADVTALSIVERDEVAPAVLTREKISLIRQSGLLEIVEPLPLERLGGLGRWKEYIANEVVPVAGDAQLACRALLLAGVPGTGKSLACKILAAQLGWPCLRCDIGRLKRGIVGASEGNMHRALSMVTAFGACVLFLDELDKGVGGYASSAVSDSGVTLGMVGQLLVWMDGAAASSNRSIIAATCNDYSKLPVELARRFDERFFVDLPTFSERIDIARIHLEHYGCKGSHAELIANMSVDWSGAEIEQLVKSAARRTRRKLSEIALRASAGDIKPISQTRAEAVSALRVWAGSALRRANSDDELSGNRAIGVIQVPRNDKGN